MLKSSQVNSLSFPGPGIIIWGSSSCSESPFLFQESQHAFSPTVLSARLLPVESAARVHQPHFIPSSDRPFWFKPETPLLIWNSPDLCVGLLGLSQGSCHWTKVSFMGPPSYNASVVVKSLSRKLLLRLSPLSSPTFCQINQGVKWEHGVLICFRWTWFLEIWC